MTEYLLMRSNVISLISKVSYIVLFCKLKLKREASTLLFKLDLFIFL